MAEPDDTSEQLPTQPWSGSAGAPSPAMPGSATGAGPSRAGWQPPEPEHLQASFAQYEIRSVLGRGGMGAVYQGWQKSLRRLVAIKILPPGLEDNGANFAERFQREAQAMARFSHPGIVAVYDAGETPDGLFYFVMEYIEGTDVQRMMKAQGPLAPEPALAITAYVCDALAYAHKRGVIHRDIKPANIMVDREGQVKVADFGLAKVASHESATLLPGSNVSMGTPDFMAPEAMLGMSAVDRRADIYAVGAMLYQMLTGRLPRGRFEVPSRCVPGLDVRLDAIIECCLQPDPEKRYSSAAELHTELVRMQTAPTSSANKHQVAPDGAELAKTATSPVFVSGVETEAKGQAAPGQRRGEVKAHFRGCSFSLAIAFGVAIFAGSWLFRETNDSKPTYPVPAGVQHPVVEANSAGGSDAPFAEPPPSVLAPLEIDLNLQIPANKEMKSEILTRIELLPNLSASGKDSLFTTVERARRIGKVLTIPFGLGRAQIRTEEIAALKAELQKPPLMNLQTDTTLVFLILGYGDPGPRQTRGSSDRIAEMSEAKKNMPLSQSRADSVLKALRDQCGVVHAMHAVGLGGGRAVDSENRQKNRTVEVWAVIP